MSGHGHPAGHDGRTALDRGPTDPPRVEEPTAPTGRTAATAKTLLNGELRWNGTAWDGDGFRRRTTSPTRINGRRPEATGRPAVDVGPRVAGEGRHWCARVDWSHGCTGPIGGVGRMGAHGRRAGRQARDPDPVDGTAGSIGVTGRHRAEPWDGTRMERAASTARHWSQRSALGRRLHGHGCDWTYRRQNTGHRSTGQWGQIGGADPIGGAGPWQDLTGVAGATGSRAQRY